MRFDMFLSMLDEGVIAVVPVDVELNEATGEMDIQSMRVGKVKVVPAGVRVELYNEDRPEGRGDPAEGPG